jgi:xylose dehydrogenase (NAD/NADP)
MTTSDPRPELRWGVLGGARIAEGFVLPALRATPGSVPLAVASSRSERAQRIAAAFDIARTYDRYEALIADPDVDAVYIALPNALHTRWTLAALAAGKHVLCEKPLATSVAEVDEIEAAAAAAQRLVVEGFMYRSHPQFAGLRSLVADGRIGTPRSVRGALSFVLNDDSDIRMATDLGGGALLDLGCYVVDAAVALYGEAPRSGSGRVTSGPTGVDVHVAGSLAFGPGSTATVEASFLLPWLGSPLEVRGDEGSLILPNAFNPGTAPTELTHVSADGKVETIGYAGVDMYRLMISEFTDAVLGNGRPATTLVESRAVQTGIALLRQP